MSDVPLTGEHIAGLVREVADELPARGQRHVIVVVGGSLLAWHGLRGTTVDVDSVARIDVDLSAAVERVAVRHGLAPKWLNDSAAGYRPQTLDEAACEVLLDHPRMRVLGAPFRDVFLMKLLAARATDHADLVTLWPLSRFASPEEAANEMYAAFPAAPEDPHLADYVADIARESDTKE